MDPHIGAIYGDSITLERAKEIVERLEAKGFASTNVVFGVGSYSMGYATRDSQGSAVKACYAKIGPDFYSIQKDPITDDGLKKSIKGLPVVYEEDGILKVKDEASPSEFYLGNLLKVIYSDGTFTRVATLDQIRNRIDNSIHNEERD